MLDQAGLIEAEELKPLKPRTRSSVTVSGINKWLLTMFGFGVSESAFRRFQVLFLVTHGFVLWSISWKFFGEVMAVKHGLYVTLENSD